MKRKILALAFAGLAITALITGCSQNNEATKGGSNLQENNQTVQSENNTDGESAITLSSEIIELEKCYFRA